MLKHNCNPHKPKHSPIQGPPAKQHARVGDRVLWQPPHRHELHHRCQNSIRLATPIAM